MLLNILGRPAKELGAVSGLTESQMSNRLSGKSPIKVAELIAWADYLDIDPGLFFINPAELRKRLLGLPVIVGQGSANEAKGASLASAGTYQTDGNRPATSPVRGIPSPVQSRRAA